MHHAKPLITAHMVVKNEDQFVFFAIRSILPYVDKMLITDTGSTDHTLSILRGIVSDKITLRETIANTHEEITKARQAQLDATKNGWIWIVDGDEIYPHKVAEEVVAAISTNKYEGVVVRRHDLLGDIYHKQDEKVGEYRLFGRRGHIVVRALNLEKIPGIHLAGSYPLEGYYDQNNVEIIHHFGANYYFSKEALFHAMYLRRSSLGNSPISVMNRGKYKVELGYPINSPIPEVFRLTHASFINNPLSRRSLAYELLASIVTPLKKIKRRIL